MVPNSACRMLLSIIGARNIRKGFRKDGTFDMDCPIGAVWPRLAQSARERSENDCGEKARRLLGAVGISEFDDVIANVGGPGRDQAREAAAVVGEQGARG